MAFSRSIVNKSHDMGTAAAVQVLSGLLVVPGVPEVAERAKMAKLADTYGKTVHADY